MMRILFLLLAISSNFFAQDAREIVTRSVKRDAFLADRAKDYGAVQTRVERDVDKAGKTQEKKREVFEVFYAYGEEFEKLVSRNGKPISADEAAKQERKITKELSERQRDFEKGRRSKADKQKAELRKLLDEIPKAFQFTLKGEETIQGMPVYVVEANPRKDYKPIDQRTKVLTKLHAILRIDKKDYQWVRSDIDFVEDATFGLFLAKIRKGSRVEVLQQRVNQEVWLPERFKLRFDAKLGGLKTIRQELETQYSNYKKFGVDYKQEIGKN
jgi:hypothetical protein